MLCTRVSVLALMLHLLPRRALSHANIADHKTLMMGHLRSTRTRSKRHSQQCIGGASDDDDGTNKTISRKIDTQARTRARLRTHAGRQQPFAGCSFRTSIVLRCAACARGNRGMPRVPRKESAVRMRACGGNEYVCKHYECVY